MTRHFRIGWRLLFVLLITGLSGCATKSPSTTKSGTTLATTAPSRAPAPATAPVEPALTEDQRQKNIDSFDIVWTTVRDKHFDPNYNGVDWNAVRTELRPKVERAKSLGEARAVMQDM